MSSSSGYAGIASFMAFMDFIPNYPRVNPVIYIASKRQCYIHKNITKSVNNNGTYVMHFSHLLSFSLTIKFFSFNGISEIYKNNQHVNKKKLKTDTYNLETLLHQWNWIHIS